MTIGFMMMLTGAIGLIVTLIWIISDIIKKYSRDPFKFFKRHKSEFNIPATAEMYEGIRDVSRSKDK